jgi:hypothetical protein
MDAPSAALLSFDEFWHVGDRVSIKIRDNAVSRKTYNPKAHTYNSNVEIKSEVAPGQPLFWQFHRLQTQGGIKGIKDGILPFSELITRELFVI